MATDNFHIYYDDRNDVVVAKIINRAANLNDPTFYIKSTKIIKELLAENKCKSLLADYSLIGITLALEMEYYYAKNINKVFDYPEGTSSAIYEGDFYSDKKWEYIRKIFKDDGTDNIEIFGNFDKALEWLKSRR